MAIVKMKRLRAVALLQDREVLLARLQRLGCVEIDEPSVDWTETSLVRGGGAGLAAAKERHAEGQRALAVLKRHAPEKGGLLRPRAVVPAAEVMETHRHAGTLEVARSINDMARQLAALTAEEGKLQAQRTALAPWSEVDLPLETTSTRDMSVFFGTVPATVPLEQLEGAALAESELCELYQASQDRELRYLLLLCHRQVEEPVMLALKPLGWSRANLRGWSGTAKALQQQAAARQEEICGERERLKQCLASLGHRRKELQLLVDATAQDVRREESAGRLAQTGSAFYLEGWVPAPREGELAALMEELSCAWESWDPAPEDHPSVPVQLKNNVLTRPLNMVTEMYSLPAYGGVDPNPLMAPFFILFYGIMMADMGYGLLMMLASVFVLKRLRPKGGMGNFFSLLGLCGISTFLMGAITGGFFGDMIPQLLKMIDPSSTFVWFWPPLFTPLDDTLMILIGSMVLGFIHINTGMAISFIKKLREGDVMGAIWEEGTWWTVFLGAGLAVAGVTPLVLALGGVMILVGAGWNAKGFGKVTAVFGSLYNHVTGYFGDILSYSRLMALMLAGSVIAQVFNTLGAIPGNIVIFFIISLAGNALNFALNLLGCYVHDLRLQCLEYFGKFYQDGGRPFRPLNVVTKYVDVAEAD